MCNLAMHAWRMNPHVCLLIQYLADFGFLSDAVSQAYMLDLLVVTIVVKTLGEGSFIHAPLTQ